jgi:NADH-quinone oxidoreductase subunit E
MLTDEEKKEIEKYFDRYEQRQPIVPEALKIVQRYRGWVSDESVRDIAKMLEVTPDEVESVATFYTMIFRRPVGRHVILICDSVSCWVMGYNPLRDHLQTILGINQGETTKDGRFTLLPVACLGICEQAPAMMVDEDVYGNLSSEKIAAILKQYE